MTRRPRRTTHRSSKQRWRLPPSRAIERWLSLRSSSTSTPTRSHRGKRSLRAGLPMFLVLRRNGAAQPAVEGEVVACQDRSADAGERFLEGALSKAGC